MLCVKVRADLKAPRQERVLLDVLACTFIQPEMCWSVNFENKSSKSGCDWRWIVVAKNWIRVFLILATPLYSGWAWVLFYRDGCWLKRAAGNSYRSLNINASRGLESARTFHPVHTLTHTDPHVDTRHHRRQCASGGCSLSRVLMELFKMLILSVIYPVEMEIVIIANISDVTDGTAINEGKVVYTIERKHEGNYQKCSRTCTF
ncbi:hypothetical protein KQX54_007667 [Cotesia glomerata]|uniref:Uncharacterized protein n=1 Tax=Cotesia glomerata TaxID=32391 RepID=A0AAV7HIG2_COTGL|nr:hypothetical protein KQX54_007667 [Cotesia glomerata]